MRVLVTRAEPEAGRTAALLAARGHQALVAPLVSPLQLPADRDPTGLAAIAVTSPRTIAMMPGGWHSALRPLPAFAVGDRTAAALRDAGFRDVRSAAGDIAALAGLIRQAGLPAGAVLLHPGGEDRAGDLAAMLAGTGVTVESPTVYRMIEAGTLPETVRDALAAGAVDAVLHYSPRSARVFADLVGAAQGVEAARRPLHACLSPAVAAALEPLAAPRVIPAVRPDEAALLDVLAT
jgi:uroporphyrinogen-III synthase